MPPLQIKSQASTLFIVNSCNQTSTPGVLSMFKAPQITITGNTKPQLGLFRTDVLPNCYQRPLELCPSPIFSRGNSIPKMFLLICCDTLEFNLGVTLNSDSFLPLNHLVSTSPVILYSTTCSFSERQN